MSRFGYVMVTYVLTIGMATAAFVDFPTKLIWNASASTPIGLYSIAPADRFEVTDLVAIRAPEPLAAFMVERGYIGRGVPLMKRIAGVPGQQVCRRDHAITVDGVPMGDALDRDHLGRSLPVWQGCRRIAQGELFLMNWSVSDSLDGRYFGPLPTSDVIGRATPLWTDEQGDGRYVWRASTR
ncbi:conjugative transfer signal peptidase TraF [Novosphingobium sp. SG751A]|uniref:S26 family signal peptidase n=1 Tax=Novosphingobium sp. SG751A TaxID=2587000 RepID=UPI0015580C37|nr:S26 family signal peptidase [Novosphingobium sp. SG751A]NOW48838.1 conjugative transfer signal peptidase TraF [Novosphingobium sp. SG751A]